ncbi:MAG: stimulus-sensing domain-containing protein [Proteobacteria bacterium]|nr:stimulus-sensing domain-containing protein [Pseudomonadota bacterium]
MRAEPEWTTAEAKGEDAKEEVAPDKGKLALEVENTEPEIAAADTSTQPVLRAESDVVSHDEGLLTKRPAIFRRPRPKRAAGVARKRLISPLTRKVLAVNFIAVLIPVAGFLSLGEYRDSLIETEMDALKTQGEVFAGAIGEGAIATTLSGDQILDIPPSQQIVRRLSESNAVRARLFLPDGELAADSRLLVAGGGIIHIQVLPPLSERRPFLDPIIDMLDWLPRRHDLPPYREAPMQNATDYEEAMGALRGETSNALRLTDVGGNYILSVAVPVQRYRQVLGALMLSKNGDDIDRAVRSLRLVVLQVFAGALLITSLLSIYLAGTIARPVRRLAEAAEKVRRDIGRQNHTIPDLTGRGDEIGDLSGSFRAMTQELQAQLDAIERFAADVSHELKNPLTSLRSAVETAARVKDQKKQRQLLAIVQDDVRRLDRLITDISDASRLDAELSRAQSLEIDIAIMLTTLADMHQTTSSSKKVPEFVLKLDRVKGLTVSGMEDRLVQIFHNLIGNAVSFSPPGGKLNVSARLDGDMVEILVEDEGPGLPEGKLEAIFDRFYSERPSDEKFGTHSGLGLSISKQIVEAHRGTIQAENIPGSDGMPAGACFIVRLPFAKSEK